MTFYQTTKVNLESEAMNLEATSFLDVKQATLACQNHTPLAHHACLSNTSLHK